MKREILAVMKTGNLAVIYPLNDGEPVSPAYSDKKTGKQVHRYTRSKISEKREVRFYQAD